VTYYSKTSEYAVEWFYQKEKQAEFYKTTFETAIRNQNLNIIGWRCSVDVSNLGQIAAEKNQHKYKVFIGKNG
jgi:glutamate synthase (ferredoxin)